MLIPEWLDENVGSLWLTVYKIMVGLQAMTEDAKEKNPERYRSKGRKIRITIIKNEPISFYDFQNKYTVYYRQGRSYYRVRPPRAVPRLDDEGSDCIPL